MASDNTVELPVKIDWLVDVINKGCPGAKGILKSYTCVRIGEGKGFLSRVCSVKFQWEPASKGLDKLPKAIVIKKPTVDIIHAVDEMTKEFIDFEKLVRFHNQECKTYEFLTKYPPCPVPMAKHFHLEHMTADDESSGLIILEDLTDHAVSLKLL